MDNTTKFDFETPVNRKGTNSLKWDKCSDPDMLPLWVADMDFKTSPDIIEALKQRVEHGVFGYSFPEEDYYEAIIDWMSRRHGWKIEREHILYTTGVVPALSAVIKALTKPGDSVVILTPVYTCFFSSIRNNECRIVESPLLIEDKKYKVNLKDLEEKLADPSTKILLLCNPHNPGGRVWSERELVEIDRLCEKHGVTVMSDEIHGDLSWPEHPYTPFGKIATAPYVSMFSSSKPFNTAGLHIASIVTPDKDMREKIDKALNINETCDVGPFGIISTTAAYRKGEPWLEAMIRYVMDNNKYLKDELKEFDDIEVLPIEGSYLAWLDVKNLGMPVDELCDRLQKEAKLWLQPGTIYGKDGEGFIRINLATSRKTLAEATTRLKAWLRKLKESEK